MSLAALSYAVALAVPAAILLALLLAGAQWLAPRLPRRRAFLVAIPTPPAERLWHRQHKLGRLRSQTVLPVMFVIIVGALLTVAEPPPPALLQTTMVQIAILLSGGLLAIAATVQAIRLTLARRQLRLLIDANLAIAQALQKISSNRNRGFHDVPTPAGVLDHVIVGLQGIYAVSVIARQPGATGDKHLQLRGDTLIFSDGSTPVALQALKKRALHFGRECSKVLGQEIKVRLVIAVPGWEIAAQPDDRLLITNERNIAMLTGWKDETDYLMDDDVDALHEHLDQRCSRPI